VKYLKPVRVGVSLLFFVVTALLFLDFIGVVTPQFMNGVTYLQFLPSLIKFLSVAGILTAGFAIVLVVTIIFGRVYCSSICPLGTLQDVFTFVSRKLNRKRVLKRAKRYDLVRFGLLVLTVAAFVGGVTVLVTLLDPFSNTGRLFSILLRPVVVAGNNLLSGVLGKFHIYAVYPADQTSPGIPALVVAAAFFGLIAWLSFTRGRLYCNLLCPVGALLGLVSRFSLMKVAINKGDCKGCSLCEHVCKGGCIDAKARTVDFDRCVVCFNCFDICPRGDMEFKTPWTISNSVPKVNPSRRRFVGNAAGAIAILAAIPAAVAHAAGKIVIVKKPTTIPTGSQHAVTPPGSRGIARFNSRCTACHLCVSACPSHVLQPSFLEYGVVGILQPRMDYRSAYCNFDCTRCGEVCPSGAILPLPQDQKKLTQIGVAKFTKENCVVYTEGTDCGACSEHCPTKAVTMVSFKEKLVIPEVRSEFCIGCGACEHACPTRPFRAIIVEAQSVHALAKKPPEQQIEAQPAPLEEFPF
jgi:polyferredoxin